MNYLAHLYLSSDSDDAIVGGMLGDFVKGPLAGRFRSEVERAISLHRGIDTYTDAHPLAKASRDRITPRRRRFAGIIVDVFYDHLLARHWMDYSVVPLEQFAQNVYETLTSRYESLPTELRRVVPRMVSENWLVNYRDRDAIERTLNRISTRIRRQNTLFGAAGELESIGDQLDRDFRGFFPELIAYVGHRKAGASPLARGSACRSGT